jgi:hypothetical protein
VKLEIEKDARARFDQPPNERGTFEREEAAADLEAARDAVQLRCKLACAPAALDIESD